MAKLFLTPIDLSKNELQNARVQNLGSAPGSPVAGQLYYDTGSNQLFYWNGSAWVNNATLLNGQNAAFYLARANHTGTQLAATISDFATTALAFRLDQFAAPTASVSLNNQKITNLATPTLATDAATKGYVDTAVQGLDQKPAAQVATITTLPANTYANGVVGVGATLTANANGVLTIDGYAVALNDRVLVKNEAAPANNGLYVLTTLGTAGVPYVLTRDTQMDQANEFGGAFIPVENKGSTTANTLWLANVAETIVVGTTAVSFTQLNAATAVTAGNGINVAGNVVSAVVDPAAGAGLALTASGLKLDTAVAVRKYAQAFGDGSSVAYVITHNLNTQDVEVSVYLATGTFAEVECDVEHTSVNTVTLRTAVAPTAGQYRVVVHG